MLSIGVTLNELFPHSECCDVLYVTGTCRINAASLGQLLAI